MNKSKERKVVAAATSQRRDVPLMVSDFPPTLMMMKADPSHHVDNLAPGTLSANTHTLEHKHTYTQTHTETQAHVYI